MGKARRPRPSDRLRRFLFGFTTTRQLQLLSELGSRALVRVSRWIGPKIAYQHLPQVSAFDCSYGVDTAGMRPWQDLGDGSWSDIYATNYYPSSPEALREAFRRLPDPEGFSFVDLGCGKGRALIVASEFPFKAIVGVEKAPELVRIAEDNARIVALAHPGRTPIRVATGDAATFALPAGDLVVYLFHPFWTPVMQSVVARIGAALADGGRRLFVVYLNPSVRGPWDACPELEVDPERSFILPGNDERIKALTVAVWRGRRP